jgi:hypothetical protein
LTWATLGHHPMSDVTVAALFVQRGGCYWDLPGVDPWDEARDARKYDGSWPVVAHPPCARWCQLAGLVEARYPHLRRGDDGGCFASALANVRRVGGGTGTPCVQHCMGDIRSTDPIDRRLDTHHHRSRVGLRGVAISVWTSGTQSDVALCGDAIAAILGLVSPARDHMDLVVRKPRDCAARRWAHERAICQNGESRTKPDAARFPRRPAVDRAQRKRPA